MTTVTASHTAPELADVPARTVLAVNDEEGPSLAAPAGLCTELRVPVR